MNRFHKDIKASLEALSRPLGDFDIGHYLGTSHEILNIYTKDKRQVARDFYKAHKELSFTEYLDLLDLLYSAQSFEEKTIASELLGLYKAHLPRVKLTYFDKWLGKLEGWAEVDTMCSGPVSADVILQNWITWEKWLTVWSGSANIQKRRASLVFLVKPVGQSDDTKLRELAYAQIDSLRAEKHVMITKAISWLLRAMSNNNPKEVKNYINNNLDSLPKIAIRETIKKIETGKKQ